MKIGKVSTKIITLVIFIATFLIGYEFGLLPQSQKVSSVSAQEIVQYSKCFALRTPSLGYDEFNQGIVDEEEAILIPNGWTPVGFASSVQGSRGTFTLVCGNGNITPEGIE